MFTLSAAAQSMENSAHHMPEQDDMGRQLEVDVQPYDSMNMSDMKLSVEELSKRLRPFHPPPPPMPLDEAKEAANAKAIGALLERALELLDHPDNPRVHGRHRS